MQASDADFGKYGKISYSIVSVSGSETEADMVKSYFTISNETGVIRVASGAKIDRELGPKQLTLQVAASDDAGPDAQQPSYAPHEKTPRMISVPIYITVEDVNDNPPKFTQREYEATTLGHADGNAAKVAVIQLSAHDPDSGINGQVAYFIKSGNIGGVFEIEQETGLIYVIKSPIETNSDRNEYKLIVEARDQLGSGPYTDEAVVRVKVIQVRQFN